MTTPFDPRAQNVFDPAHDVYRYTPRSLQPIFAPKTVAVIGATEKVGSVGRTVIWNLISSPFGGTVYPVNPKRENILGIRAYPNIKVMEHIRTQQERPRWNNSRKLHSNGDQCPCFWLYLGWC